MPSVERAVVGAHETPLEVVEQPAMAVIPLPMIGQMGLPTSLVALTVVGATQLVGTPPTQMEMAVAMAGEPKSSTTVVAPKAPARPAPSVVQVTAPGVRRMEGDATEGSPGIMVLGEGSASIPLTPSISRGSVPVGTSR